MANIVLSILGNDKTGDATKSATHNLTTVQELAKRTKALALGVGAAVGVGIGAVLKTGFDEAKDGSAGLAQLEAGVKSTGGAAGVTTGHMENLASSIQSMSGQTDDSIVKAQQLLLTFTGIKNQGPHKVFDDATRAAADMAAKMGGDASSQAMLLGKALNDPATGISKLTKVGVTFTDAQKDQVAAMVKSGDTAGAQGVILKELQTEFGGAADAAGKSLPGQLARAQRSFEDLSQGVVEALLPIMSAVLPTLIAGIKAVTPAFADVAKWITENKGLIPVLAVAIGVLTIAFWALSATPVTLLFAAIVVAVIAVIAIVVLLVTHWGDVVNFFRTIWAGIVKWFTDTLAALGKSWNDLWTNVGSFFKGIWDGIVNWAKDLWNGFVATNKAIFQGVVNWFRDLWNGYFTFWKNVWNTAVEAALLIARGFISTAKGVWNGLVNFFQDLFDGIAGFFRTSWNGAISFLQGIPGKIKGFFDGIGSWLVNSGENLIGGLIRGITNSISAAKNAVKGVVDAIAGFFPHSPAKEGPFSGRGYTTYSGQSLIEDFAGGIASRAGSARSTISGVLSSIVPSLTMSGLGISGAVGAGAAVAGGASGGINIGQLNTTNGANASEIVNEISWQARRMPV